MGKGLKSFLKVLFILTGSWLVLALVLTGIRDSELGILPELFWSYLTFSAFLELSHYFIPLFLSTLVLNYGFLVKIKDLPAKEDGSLDTLKSLKSIFLPILAGVVLSSLISLAFVPFLEDSLEGWRFNSRQVSALAEQLKAEKQVSQQIERIKQMLWYLSNTEDLRLELKRLEDRKSQEDHLKQYYLGIVELWKVDGLQDETVESLVVKAMKLMAQGDPATANDRAFRALQMFGFPRVIVSSEALQWKEKAQEILEETWKIVRGSRLTTEALTKAGYFHRKNRAFEEFRAGQYLESYYSFLRLSEENILDEEAVKYRNLSLDELRPATLFVEELSELFLIPTHQNLVFRLPSNGMDQEWLAINALKVTPAGVFAKGIELMRLDGIGRPQLIIQSPYAQLLPGLILMHTRSLIENTDRYLPTLVLGSPKSESILSHPFSVPLSDLKFLSDSSPLLQSLNIVDLYSMAGRMKGYGRPTTPLWVEWVERLLIPLLLFCLSYLAVMAAWTYRSLYSGLPPWFLWPILFALPLVFGFLLELLLWVFALVSGILSTLWGPELTILLYIGALTPLTGWFMARAIQILSR